MSYLALLFCQDEKTARTITQVLNELEFQVEPSSEAFAAVKKLTTQAFDAVVVDCQSEDNASLLLKAARNSASNQSSLMVALVEGQAGVASAFRIGANLVLTKPIAVEQARSTLRVARGLLRKSTGPAVAAAPSAAPTAVPTSIPSSLAPSVPAAVAASSVSLKAPVASPLAPAALKAAAKPAPSAAPAPSPRPSVPAIARTVELLPVAPVPVKPSVAAARIPVPPSALRAVAASAGLVTEPEHQPAPDAASAGLLEAMEFKTFEAAPERSFGLSASESVSVVEVSTGAHEAVRSALAPRVALSSQDFGSFGAAAAAPARELPKATAADHPAVADLFEAPVFGQATSGQTTGSAAMPMLADAAPYSAELDLTGGQAASRSKAPMLAVVALLVFAGAAYLGYTQLRKPAGAAATAGPLQPPPPDFGSAEQTPAHPPSRAGEVKTPVDPSAAPVEVVNRFARPSRSAGGEQVAPDEVTTPVGVVPSRASITRISDETPIQVKAEMARPQPVVQESAEAPSIAALGTASQPEALNAITHATTAVPAAPTSQRISQGVSDGLLIRRVQPIYPQQALQMHTEGKVALQATIGKDGAVRNVKVVSGPAVLARAASDAVRQWRYRPYTLNGEPIEVQTDININFVPPR